MWSPFERREGIHCHPHVQKKSEVHSKILDWLGSVPCRLKVVSVRLLWSAAKRRQNSTHRPRERGAGKFPIQSANHNSNCIKEIQLFPQCGRSGDNIACLVGEASIGLTLIQNEQSSWPSENVLLRRNRFLRRAHQSICKVDIAWLRGLEVMLKKSTTFIGSCNQLLDMTC